MSDIVVKVENVGKKYILLHEKQERYTALRDVMTNKAKHIATKIISPFTQKIVPQDDFKSKEEFWALKDISFDIKQGDRLGIIGRNGAGKSTLLKVLSRITEPSKGRISVKGRVASLLEVGTGFHPELTGRENIWLNGAILGMQKHEIKRQFDAIVDFSEVENFLDTPVKRYSSGMYVRLAFSVAAHLEPEILVVDEVLAVGDFAFQEKCLGKMRDVGQGGRTVIFVSHNMGAVSSLCKTAIWIDKGNVVKSGTADEVVGYYLKNQATIYNDTSFSTVRQSEEVKHKSFYVHSVEMVNTDDQHTNTFNYNDELILNVSLGGLPGERFSLEFYVYNELGQFVAVGASGAYHGIYFEKDIQKIRIKIGPLFLTKGKYTISLSLVKGIDGIDTNRTDTWQNAIGFSILECKPFINRDISTLHEGACILKQSFSEIR
jgi:lipopolysaccharide transport system ATP-binding protein